jgi:hypothetical protein
MGYIPKITYPAAVPTTTVSFTTPPNHKPGPYGIADQEGVGVQSVSLSGKKQVMYVRTDTFFHLIMELVPWADMTMWQTFILFALQGGTFRYYPDSGGTAFDEYSLEDAGGSARNQDSDGQLYSWNPTSQDHQHATFELVFRKVPGGLTHA